MKVVKRFRIWYHLNMSKFKKLISSLKSNPKGDWKIEDLKRIAHKLDIDYRQPGTSHVTFRCPSGDKLTVPVHKPVKPFHIKMFVEMLEKQVNDDG
jgi:hypothetical protein